ncbi:hypothetical protein EYF80_026208 [Liparis tanakae]|uniref:Uncharacterized protein n=1 Tax=Liparis tanakae TaxID=230148 RepID=A0A4Z2HCS2_9TELE|nr:hypothetical protein EYF80_026208 [Liparis tanakae]
MSTHIPSPAPVPLHLADRSDPLGLPDLCDLLIRVTGVTSGCERAAPELPVNTVSVVVVTEERFPGRPFDGASSPFRHRKC